MSRRKGEPYRYRRSLGDYPPRPEIRPRQHGVAADPTFWVRKYEEWKPEEEAEAAETPEKRNGGRRSKNERSR